MEVPERYSKSRTEDCDGCDHLEVGEFFGETREICLYGKDLKILQGTYHPRHCEFNRRMARVVRTSQQVDDELIQIENLVRKNESPSLQSQLF